MRKASGAASAAAARLVPSTTRPARRREREPCHPAGGVMRQVWARDAFFYHVYPLGLCGAEPRNDFHSAPVPRLDQLRGWIGHLRWLGADALYLGPLFESGAHG